MPTTKLYRRGKPEEKKEEKDKYDRFGLIGGDIKRDRDGRDPNKRFDEATFVHTK